MVNIMNELVYIQKIRFNPQKRVWSARPINSTLETLNIRNPRSCMMSCGISMNFTMQAMHLRKPLPSIVPKHEISFSLREDLAHNLSRKTVWGRSNDIARMVPSLWKLRKHPSPAFPLPPPLLQEVCRVLSPSCTQSLRFSPECEASGVKTETSWSSALRSSSVD